jgi:hypothetical protein
MSNQISFTAPKGETLFLIEGEVVHILGDAGTEASFPLGDLKAFLEHLGIYLDRP